MPESPVNMSSGLPETALDPEPAEAREALAAALATPEDLRRDAVAQVATRWPRYLDAWARLGGLVEAGAAASGSAADLAATSGSAADLAATSGSAADLAATSGSAADLAATSGSAADLAAAYACYRVGYHRGLDQLRQSGWRGQGYVRWRHAPNRGFLRSLAGLARVAGAIGEDDEARRCLTFIAQLDPGWDGTE